MGVDTLIIGCNLTARRWGKTPGTDVGALAAHRITVTALKTDFTDYEMNTQLETALGAVKLQNAQMKDREGFAAFMLRMRSIGFDNNALIAAMEAVPRRGFIPSAFSDAVWSHRTAPIDCGEVIEGVDIQAKLIDMLNLEPHHRILEIGTGSCHSAAVMARLSERVLTYDRFQTLVDQVNYALKNLKLAMPMHKKWMVWPCHGAGAI